jgi:NADH-quinone oxidoreductase subunit C
MTTALAAQAAAAKIKEKLPDSVIAADGNSLLIKTEYLVNVLSFLKTAPGLELDYLTSMHAVDYWDYFEVAYQLVSLTHNHSVILKVYCKGRKNLSLPSSATIYKSADLQEREIFDLMGIRFEGHPNLKRIVLWEGFQGHPLRKDYL